MAGVGWLFSAEEVLWGGKISHALLSILSRIIDSYCGARIIIHDVRYHNFALEEKGRVLARPLEGSRGSASCFLQKPLCAGLLIIV